MKAVILDAAGRIAGLVHRDVLAEERDQRW